MTVDFSKSRHDTVAALSVTTGPLETAENGPGYVVWPRAAESPGVVAAWKAASHITGYPRNRGT